LFSKTTAKFDYEDEDEDEDEEEKTDCLLLKEDGFFFRFSERMHTDHRTPFGGAVVSAG
jgi:hypothetical protein